MGGIQVAATISSDLNIDNNRFFKLSMPLISEKDVRLDGDLNHLLGNILILDDASRTGSTLKRAMKYFNERKSVNNADFKLYTATLTCSIETGLIGRNDIFCVYQAPAKIKLPWHGPQTAEYIDKIEKLEQQKKEVNEAKRAIDIESVFNKPLVEIRETIK